MKRSLLFVLAIGTWVLTGCVPGFYQEVDERLTNLPIEPHNNEIEVLFAGEWPQEEYIKVAALETRAGENVPYIDLIKNLKAKARRYGADAVLVQEKGFISDVHTQVITNWVATTATGVLTGIAIKYKKNLETGLMPKQQEVEMYDPISGTFVPLLQLQFSPGGEIKYKNEWSDNGLRLYNTFIQEYSLRQLKLNGPGWTQRRQEGYVVERQLHKGGLLIKQLDFNYDMQRRVQQVRINVHNGISEEINFTYDADGRLTSRSIQRNKEPYLLEEYTYDESGQVRETQLYNISLPEKIPFLRSTYAYYSLEEL
jgi:YD repeat-containing protein